MPAQCYYDAWMHLVRQGYGELVHGTVYGGYPKRVIKHAWVEYDGKVYDPQLWEEFNKDFYYETFSARPERRYNLEDATVKSFRTEIYGGPWE